MSRTRIAGVALLAALTVSAAVVATAGASTQQPQWRVNSKVLWKGNVELKLSIETKLHPKFTFVYKVGLVTVEVACDKVGGDIFIVGNEKGHGLLEKGEMTFGGCETKGMPNCTTVIEGGKAIIGSVWLRGPMGGKEIEGETGGNVLVVILEPEGKTPFAVAKLTGNNCVVKGEYFVSGDTITHAVEVSEAESKTLAWRWQTPNGKFAHQKVDVGAGEEERKNIKLETGGVRVEINGDITVTMPEQKREIELQTVGAEVFEKGVIKAVEFGVWKEG